MGRADHDDIQSAIEASLRRQSTEAATRGESTLHYPAELLAPHLIVLRSLGCELHALLDDVGEQTLPMYFGKHLGELRMRFPR
jgi:hypothetical protein